MDSIHDTEHPKHSEDTYLTDALNAMYNFGESFDD